MSYFDVILIIQYNHDSFLIQFIGILFTYDATSQCYMPVFYNTITTNMSLNFLQNKLVTVFQALLSGSSSSGPQASTDELLLTLILQEHERQVQADKEQQNLVTALANTIQKYEQQRDGAAFDYAHGRSQLPDNNLPSGGNMAIERLLQAVRARQLPPAQQPMASSSAQLLMMPRPTTTELPHGVAGGIDAKQKARQQVEQRRQELLQRYDDVERKIYQNSGQTNLTHMLGAGEGGSSGIGMKMQSGSTLSSTLGSLYNPYFGVGSAPGNPEPSRRYW